METKFNCHFKYGTKFKLPFLNKDAAFRVREYWPKSLEFGPSEPCACPAALRFLVHLLG